MEPSFAPALGRGLILGSLLFASLGAIVAALAAYRADDEALRWARRLAYAFAGSAIAANLLMVRSLLVHDFSVSYVAEVGSRATPVYFTIVSLWASLDGSILFWSGVLAVYVAAWVASVGDQWRAWAAWSLAVLLAIAVFFAFITASIANPFEAMVPVPPDGPGPNPLLQNHWLMAIHPPTLYLGYVGMAVPYAMMAGALLAGRLDSGWMGPIRTWMMIPWTFLTVGIVLGGWWSYEVLGWGGAWAWDPVENASFHPWLTGTAFLHSLMLLQRRGTARDWTLVLGLSTFLLTLVGTFMTRSGVFNSVHSFTQSDIGPVFLVFIGIVLTASVILLATRSHVLDAWDAEPAMPPAPVSRETMILLQNALFTVFTFTVLLGTLYPLVTEALEDRRVSVGEPYFDRWALPIGLGIVFLMGVGPALPWGRARPEALRDRLGIPGTAAVLTTVACLAFGIDKPITLLTLALCGFASVANIRELTTPILARRRAHGTGWIASAVAVVQRGRRRTGSVIAHLGVVAAVIALAMSKAYRIEEDVHLQRGESMSFVGFDLRFISGEERPQAHRTSWVATFDATRNGETIRLEPKSNLYPRQREPVFTPAVHPMFTGDLYLSLIELPADRESVVLRAIWMPAMWLLWICAPIIALGALIAAWPERRRSTP